MDITASVLSDFRIYYPEFGDDAVWSDGELTRHLHDADQETGSTRWGAYAGSPPSFKARGLFAYAAHRAVMAQATRKAVQAGGSPAAPARTQSKSVGDESWTYAVATPESGSISDAQGDLPSTYYGQEFLRLRRRAGAGGGNTGQVTL